MRGDGAGLEGMRHAIDAGVVVVALNEDGHVAGESREEQEPRDRNGKTNLSGPSRSGYPAAFQRFAQAPSSWMAGCRASPFAVSE